MSSPKPSHLPAFSRVGLLQWLLPACVWQAVIFLPFGLQASAGSGALYAWGTGTGGQLGNNTTAATQVMPVAVDMTGVPAGNAVTTIATGLAANHSLVLAPSGAVASIAANSGSTGGGTSVTITGTNFTGAAGVTIGGTAATAGALVTTPPVPVVKSTCSHP